MKKLVLIVLIAFIALLSAGCTSRTDFGECIGAFEDKDPTLNYKLSVWNTAMAVIFVETIVVPVVVVANEAICPESRKVTKR